MSSPASGTMANDQRHGKCIFHLRASPAWNCLVAESPLINFTRYLCTCCNDVPADAHLTGGDETGIAGSVPVVAQRSVKTGAVGQICVGGNTSKCKKAENPEKTMKTSRPSRVWRNIKSALNWSSGGES